jgi:hypothetical protein
MRQVIALVFAAVAVLGAPLHGGLAQSSTCDPPNDAPPPFGETEVSDGSAAHTFYIDVRHVTLDVWLYQESNGVFVGGDPVKDLQRGGNSFLVGNLDSDPCTDSTLVPPDTLVF